ncbi:sensor domain-containing diguanylate cyclase [Azospirillum brasilense]|uniref:sensor domain-containing diguanylate cyclase n=1 Tax=Azospirillum brasilense TaxID=192 RepID=UPI001586138A|nr:sensor domain-containing diguanylate cyclase [Azospirillum brasilense]
MKRTRILRRAQTLWARVGLRARLEAFILLALLPLVGLVLVLLFQERSQDIERAREDTRLLADRGAAQQAQIVEQARNVLQLLTLVPDVREASPERCSTLLKRATELYPWAAGFGVFNPDGNLLCSSNSNRPANLAGRDYFQKALATRGFTVSNFLIGQNSKKPRVVTALPILDDDGSVSRMLVAGVDLSWLAELSAEIAHESGGIVSLFDSQGTILARVPDPQGLVGQSMADHPILRSILREEMGIIEGDGLDGVPRISGFSTLEETGAKIVVAVARDDILAAANRNLLLGTGVMVGVVLLIGGGVWVLMEVMVLRGLRDLKASAATLSSDLFDPNAPCIPAPVHPSEFSQVAQAMRTMGRTLSAIAFEDRLTGLANRRFFEAHVERLQEQPESNRNAVAILYIDLDGFKPINDQHGHHTGDLVLKEIGERLARCVRHGDFAARLGGDEFTVLLALPDGHQRHYVLEVARRIIDSVSTPIMVDGLDIQIGCSIGVALWPTDAADLTLALQHADRALYAAKRAGRARVVSYSDLPADNAMAT